MADRRRNLTSKAAENQPASGTAAYMMIANQIRKAIKGGSLPKGAVLLEGPLAALFGSSRSPVKRALASLEEERLLSSFDGRGLLVGKTAEPNRIKITPAMLQLEAAGAISAKSFAWQPYYYDFEREIILRSVFGRLNRAFLCVPDGMPTVWVGRMQGHSGMARIYGPDYMMAMCRQSLLRGYRHFLYGGAPGVVDLLASKLQVIMPWLQIVGTHTPPYGPLTAKQEAELASMVARTKPDIFWVGLSTPKQERFMARYLERLDVKLMAGVGAAFDLHAGLRRDAPHWMKQCGLQWLHRLCQEPRRLGPRYLKHNPRFIREVCGQLARSSEFRLER